MGYNNVDVMVSGPNKPSSTYKTKILKGNHSFASQVTEANTKYVIKYNFDLNGETVTIPANCILEFDGGSISGNYTLTGNNTCIKASPTNIFGHDINISGTWDSDKAYLSWFNSNDSYAINNAIKIGRTIIFNGNTFICDRQIQINKNNIKLIGNNSKIKFISSDNNNFGEFLFNISGENILLENLNIESASDGGFRNPTSYGAGTYIVNAYSTKNLILKDVIIEANDINPIIGSQDPKLDSAHTCFATYYDFENLSLINCKFINNAVTKAGGCVWIRNLKQANKITNGVYIKDCYMYLKDTVDEVLAIYNVDKDCIVNLYDTTIIAENTTFTTSHSVWINNAKVQFSNCSITHKDTVNGIFISGNAIANFNNCNINVNSTSLNRGIYVTDSARAYFNGCKYTENNNFSSETPMANACTFDNCIITVKSARTNDGLFSGGTVKNSILYVYHTTGSMYGLGKLTNYLNNKIIIRGDLGRLFTNPYAINNIILVLEGTLQDILYLQNSSNKDLYLINNTIIDVNGTLGSYKRKGYIQNFSGKINIYNNTLPSTIIENTYVDNNTGTIIDWNNKFSNGTKCVIFKDITCGTTSNRPVLTNKVNNFQYYDTTLGKPIWWNGTAWVDATGATV